ncbi:unnamed protein product, partial [Closterium sp. NIES-65]
DPEVLQEAVRFYHMMVVWLVRFVGGFHLPLPAPAPKDWASMPEHFVDDAIETLLLASRIPHALDGLRLVRGDGMGWDGRLMVVVSGLATTHSSLVVHSCSTPPVVYHSWNSSLPATHFPPSFHHPLLPTFFPPISPPPPPSRPPPHLSSPTPTVAASMASLFEGHPLAMRHLAPNLIKLYVDVEFTGSHNAVSGGQGRGRGKGRGKEGNGEGKREGKEG